MATFVLVHGSWHGSWCWDPVRRRLEAAGHRVEAPALTGLGERAHLLSLRVGLHTHVADVLGVLRSLGAPAWASPPVVLVGHSYGGMVTTVVAGKAPGAVDALAYLDGYVPEPGRTELDYWDPGEAAAMRAAAARGLRYLPPPDPAVLGLTDPDVARWARERLTPHPVLTYLAPAPRPADLLAERFEALPRAYLFASEGTTAARFAPFAEAGRTGGWAVAELRTGHDAMLTEPEAAARFLMRAALGAA